ncbi:MAG: tryptophan--tRNA ligase [Anaerolineae bacterium]|nr:tryptophan--tRNA ligase [Anaerolineae bacterium]
MTLNTTSEKQRVLSGVQPSGNLTIGNYLGALSQWAAEYQHYESYFCVVDMHAITVPHNPAELAAKTREVAGLYIASGIDPEVATIFVQSQVAAHAELAWVLNCLTPVGWLQRMTQFKDKSAKLEQESVGTGLLTYPVLMAADILLYQAHKVPVGDDQKQHLELTRDVAQRFNFHFGETFVVPEAMIRETAARIMGLDDPTKKMSKSETDSQYHAVYLLDPPDMARKKIMRAVTDSGRDIRFSDDPEKAGVNNLLQIYEVLTGADSRQAVEAHFEGKGYGDLKREVAEVVLEAIAPIRARYNEIAEESGYLDDVLARGAERAAAFAEKTLRTVKERVGFLDRR